MKECPGREEGTDPGISNGTGGEEQVDTEQEQWTPEEAERQFQLRSEEEDRL